MDNISKENGVHLCGRQSCLAYPAMFSSTILSLNRKKKETGKESLNVFRIILQEFRKVNGSLTCLSFGLTYKYIL